jgi:hypothetical protein
MEGNVLLPLRGTIHSAIGNVKALEAEVLKANANFKFED